MGTRSWRWGRLRAAVCVAAVAVAAVEGRLEDIERECPLEVCSGATVAAPVVAFTCKGLQEIVGSVLASSVVGKATLTQAACAAALNETGGPAALGPRCEAAEALVSSMCLNKESCEVDLTAALASCGVGADQVLAVQISCSAGFDALAFAIWGAVVIIGLGMGTTMHVAGLREICSKHMRSLLVGFFSQFLVMPLFSYVLAVSLNVNELVAVGMVIVGSCPGGAMSNLLTYWAKGNVTLSITMSAASLALAVGTMPLLVYLYGNLALGVSGVVSVPFANIFFSVLLATIPPAIGAFVRHKSDKWAGRLEIVGSVVGGLFLLATFVIGILGNSDLLDPSKYPNVWIASVLFQPVGCLLGYGIARLWRLPRPESRAVCLETGIQNLSLAIALIASTYTGCLRGQVLIFPLAAGFMFFVNNVWITLLLRFVMSRYDTPEERASRDMNVVDDPKADAPVFADDQAANGDAASDASDSSASARPGAVELELGSTAAGHAEADQDAESDPALASCSMKVSVA